jgi:hypothetical protein
MTPWQSIPSFVRFAIWLASIVFVLSVAASVAFGAFWMLVLGAALGGGS